MTEQEILHAKQKYEKAQSNNDYSWFTTFIDKGKLSINDLLNNDIMPQAEIDKYLIDKDQHQTKINNNEYSLSKIKGLTVSGVIDRAFVNRYLAVKLRANANFRQEIVKSGLLNEEEIDSTLISKPEHDNKVKNGEYNLQKIKQLLTKRIITDEPVVAFLKSKLKSNFAYKTEIISAGLFDEAYIDKFVIDKESHIIFIKDKKYSTNKIKSLINKNIINEQDLIRSEVFTADELSLLTTGKKQTLVTPAIRIDEIPPLVKGRTDVFVFGLPQSGKSTFMASLIFYATNRASAELTLEKSNTNHIGNRYAHILDQSIKEERLLEGNPEGDLQYMTIDFYDKQSQRHPLTFFEMAGEDFEGFYDKTTDQFHPKIKEYLVTNPNKKIFFMVIDSTYSTNQIYKLINILQKLEIEGTLDTVTSIAVLLTKWDKNNDKDPVEYLEKNYKALFTLGKKYQNKYMTQGGLFKKPQQKLKFRAFHFSIGEFNEDNSDYKYNDTDAKKIYEWLISVSDFK